ncbi:hypothetical protein DFH28DRAFT_879773, partial [Melampsora americana]
GTVQGMDWTNEVAEDVEDPPNDGLWPQLNTTPNIWDQDDSTLFKNPSDAHIKAEPVVHASPDLIWDAAYKFAIREEDENSDDGLPDDERRFGEQENEIEYDDDDDDDMKDGEHKSEAWSPFNKKEVCSPFFHTIAQSSLVHFTFSDAEALTVCV